MDIIVFFLILLAALITASGQLLLKKGSQILRETLTWQKNDQFDLQLIKKIFSIFIEPHILIAIVLYVVGLLVWVKILSQSELNYAYPILISITILITIIASAFIYKESITVLKLLGIICIIVGIFLMTSVKN